MKKKKTRNGSRNFTAQSANVTRILALVGDFGGRKRIHTKKAGPVLFDLGDDFGLNLDELEIKAVSKYTNLTNGPPNGYLGWIQLSLADEHLVINYDSPWSQLKVTRDLNDDIVVEPVAQMFEALFPINEVGEDKTALLSFLDECIQESRNKFLDCVREDAASFQLVLETKGIRCSIDPNDGCLFTGICSDAGTFTITYKGPVARLDVSWVASNGKELEATLALPPNQIVEAFYEIIDSLKGLGESVQTRSNYQRSLN
jgi:hypothetical protein